jgi:hypothetical protein
VKLHIFPHFSVEQKPKKIAPKKKKKLLLSKALQMEESDKAISSI